MSSNQLDGDVPSELSALDSLRTLKLDNNQLENSIPQLFTILDLETFYFDETNLCEPVNHTFQSWLSRIPFMNGTGTLCDDIYYDVFLPSIVRSE